MYFTFSIITLKEIDYLNLHPASKIVSEEICGDWVKHIDLVWSESYCLFVEIIPCTSKPSCLIPNFLQLRVILNDDCVFDIRSLKCINCKINISLMAWGLDNLYFLKLIRKVVPIYLRSLFCKPI